MTPPRDHHCAICGKTPAPFGFRKRGPLSAQKARTYLWVCAEHREEAEKRKGKD